MRRTSAIVVATLTTTALALSACGRDSASGGESGATAKDVSSGKATGTITVWAMGAEGEKLPALAKEFEAANPGAKVNVTAIPWDAAHDKFTTAITAGKTPDAAMVGTTWMGEFAGLDALDPTPPSIDKSEFFEGAQKTTEVDGTSYGIPWYVETRLVYYRTDLAKKAGFNEAPKDWEGLKSMAKAMQTKAGAKWGIGLQAGGTGSLADRDALRVVQRRQPHQGRRQGLQLRHPGDQGGRRVLPELLHRGHLRQGRSGHPDHRARLRQRQGPDVHLRPVDDVGRREGRW